MPNTPTTDMRDLAFRYHANAARLREIADLCESEQRDLTDAERTERESITREMELQRMRIAAAGAADSVDVPDMARRISSTVRENILTGRVTQISLQARDLVSTAVLNDGVVPMNVGELIEPLVEGLILDKVGLPMPTGLRGEYVWPTYETVEATIAGEGVALSDTPINLGKLTASPERIGIAIPVTRQTLIQSDGMVETIIRRVIPLAVAKLLNKILFSTAKVAGAANLVGPFAGIPAAKVAKLSATPTFKEFVMLKAKVLAEGVDGENLCFVMTQSQKAIAEATPKDAGSGLMVCENDRIAGVPVFTTNYIGEGNIGLGDWRFQPMGLFGEVDFIIDPYSKARNNAVDFVLNVNYATTTLRKEAFVLGKCTTA